MTNPSEKDSKSSNIFNENELERDRAARGYGFEIGRGHALTEIINETSDDNPFVNKNWRDAIVEEDLEDTIELNNDKIQKAKTNDPFEGMKRAGEITQHE